jgi:hypothetical protein
LLYSNVNFWSATPRFAVSGTYLSEPDVRYWHLAGVNIGVSDVR